MNAQQISDRIVNKSGSYQEVMSYAEGMILPLIQRAEAAEADNVGLRATLRDEILRAESAEAELEETSKAYISAEVRVKSWRDSAMTLADQRDAALEELRLEKIESQSAWDNVEQWTAAANRIAVERDAALNVIEQSKQTYQSMQAEITALQAKLDSAQRKIDALTTQLGLAMTA